MRKILLPCIALMLVLTGCSFKEFEPYIYQDVEVIDVNDSTDPRTFIRDVENVGLDIEVEETDLDITKPGTYTITYKISLGRKSVDKTFTIKVKDYDAPVITMEDEINIPYGGTFLLQKYATAFDSIDGDVSESLHYTGGINLYEEGRYPIKVLAEDQYGNVTEKEATVVVAKDSGYKSEIYGEYKDKSYTDGQAPTLTLNEDGRFSIYLNSCSVVNLIEGKYKQILNELYLVADNNGFSYTEEENVVKFVIETDGTLSFSSMLNLCAPNYGDEFVKE